MPRLRNRDTGAVVNVSDATAEKLGFGWESLDEEPKPRRSTRKRSTKSDDDE